MTCVFSRGVRLFLAAGLLLEGCASRPHPYKPPDSSTLVESGRRIAGAVVAAHTTARLARGSLAEAARSSQREGDRLAALPPKLSELLRIAPVELRPVVAALQIDVSDLQRAHEMTVAQIAETQRAQSALASELEKANAAKNENAIAQMEFIAAADHFAALATGENAARVKAENSLLWYRLRWWGSWAALGAGMVGCGIFALLKFTGRLAMKMP